MALVVLLTLALMTGDAGQTTDWGNGASASSPAPEAPQAAPEPPAASPTDWGNGASSAPAQPTAPAADAAPPVETIGTGGTRPSADTPPAEMTAPAAPAETSAPAPADAAPAPAMDAPAAAEAPAAGEEPFPKGAPHDDYGFVAWCQGALQIHMQLHDLTMPEVERIERAFPSPDTPVEDALKVYDDQHKEGAKDLKLFEHALAVSEKHEHRSKADRQAAIAVGESVWNGATEARQRDLAQMWMSWELPSRCVSTARRMEKGK